MNLSDFDIWYRTRYRRTSSSLTTTAFIISDLIAILLSFAWGFFWVRIYGFIVDYDTINARSFITYWPYLPAFIIIFQIHRLYPGVSLAPSEEMRRFFIGSFVAYGGIMMARFIDNNHWDSVNTAFLIAGVFSTLILLTARSVMHWILHKTRLGGIPTVIYGSGKTGKLVVDCLLGSIRTGYVPVCMIDDNPLGEDEYRNIPIIHDFNAGPEIVKRYNIKMAIVAMPSLDAVKLKNLLNTSVSAFRYNVIIPNFYNISSIWMSIRDFSGVLGIDTSNKLKITFNLAIKRFVDISIVVLGGIIILPFLLIAALLVKISSPGPVLYKQKRIGINGNHFYTYKFRSMVINADEVLQKLLESNPQLQTEWEQTHKLQNDPRITGIGKFLRRTSIDEFPQFINILKGEMSLVGPRPIVDAEIIKYGDDYSRVFSVKPGLTGLWQVSGRSNADYLDRVAYDIYYLQSWSVWLDMWIIFKTFGVVIMGKGAY
ncbi:MAG: undecaprenyl-phosphate galactose phosphotransferase WbaP [Treponema sp.]|nr:undecaprenyl-phosphate galactose phosphotransferase WbaP [Treponema sp.]MCL2250398.1 undecaprenyl-phosphate galactose phosphotransferase WbaP [Treponema sp.]